MGSTLYKNKKTLMKKLNKPSLRILFLKINAKLIVEQRMHHSLKTALIIIILVSLL